MADGTFERLNGDMVTNKGMGDGVIISVIGSMESTDGTTMSLRASDGVSLQYAIQPEFDFEQVRKVNRLALGLELSEICAAIQPFGGWISG